MSTILAYSGAVGFAISQSIYSYAVSSRFNMQLPELDRIAVVLIVQVIPVALLLAVRAATGSRRRLFDASVFAMSAVMVLLQIYMVALKGLSSPSRMAAIVAVAVTGVAVVYAARAHVQSYVVMLGVTSLVMPTYFLVADTATAVIATAARSATVDARQGPTNTVFVLVFDELSLEILLDPSHTRIDATRFPNFARFAAESVWLRNARADYLQTNVSLRSVFTGTYERVDAKGRTFDIEDLPPPNLFSELASNGYRVSFYSRYIGCRGAQYNCLRYSETAPEVLYRFANFQIGRYVPPSFRAIAARPDLREAQLLENLGRGEFARAGQAIIVHVLATHYPYVVSRAGAVVTSTDTAFEFLNPGDPPEKFAADADRIKSKYVGEVEYVDARFGMFVDDLKRTGNWDHATVVVTADHGTCWVPSCAGRNHIVVPVPSLLRVPLFIRTAGMKPRISDAAYRHVDFFATMLDALGLPSRASDGVSMMMVQ
ncbi:MAG TPA: sulfatase-like hydrolase/transferase [Vicinamibacterales bacterium]|nr:sulfatase-like hydrolase/transferase [Vicinamibacterales bacterium]